MMTRLTFLSALLFTLLVSADASGLRRHRRTAVKGTETVQAEYLNLADEVNEHERFRLLDSIPAPLRERLYDLMPAKKEDGKGKGEEKEEDGKGKGKGEETEEAPAAPALNGPMSGSLSSSLSMSMSVSMSASMSMSGPAMEMLPGKGKGKAPPAKVIEGQLVTTPDLDTPEEKGELVMSVSMSMSGSMSQSMSM